MIKPRSLRFDLICARLIACSGGKTFSVTGWKIGWVVGHAELVRNVMLANQWVQFSVATPLQVYLCS